MGAVGAFALAAALLAGCSSSSNEPPEPPPPSGMVDPPPPPPPPLSAGPEDCTDGRAGDFPCSGVSLAARVTLQTMGGAGAMGNDLWGWTDPQTAREYALMGLSNGTAFVDVTEPSNPLFAGCHNVTRTHDTQCVVYEGPDAAHRGRQICVSSNEDRLEVVDVTEKAAPLSLSSITYPQMGYVHQGWLTEDHRYFLLGDELDELHLNLYTRTHVFDVTDLDAPEYLYAHDLGTFATDHNLYVLGERVFEANYTSGLRVLRFGDLASGDMTEIAFFDTYPATDGPGTEGAWSVYPYLPSGTILVSDIANGLFVLTMP